MACVLNPSFRSPLTHSPQVGLLSFGAASLLYLITEELLVEAHEEGGPHAYA